MTTLQDIQQAITASVGSAYPLIAPTNPLPPYAVYFRVSSSPENTVADGYSIENTRVQVDIFARTYAEALTLSNAVSKSLTTTYGGLRLNTTDMYEDAIQLFRISQDFSFWLDVEPVTPTYIYPGEFNPLTGRYN